MAEKRFPEVSSGYLPCAKDFENIIDKEVDTQGAASFKSGWGCFQNCCFSVFVLLSSHPEGELA